MRMRTLLWIILILLVGVGVYYVLSVQGPVPQIPAAPSAVNPVPLGNATNTPNTPPSATSSSPTSTPNPGELFTGNFTTSVNGVQSKVTYSFMYSKAIFSVSNPAGKPSEADLKEKKSGKVHKIIFYNNSASKYATPADYWTGQKPCAACTFSTSTPTAGGTGEMLSVYEDAAQAWLIWKHTADLFIAIQVSKPAAPQIQDVVKTIQVTTVSA